jgi:hypothetical protein
LLKGNIMARKAKASIYSEDGAICNSDLLRQLNEAILELEDKMKASIPIFKGTLTVGFGVNKIQRGIAISVAKAIKALKGW